MAWPVARRLSESAALSESQRGGEMGPGRTWQAIKSRAQKGSDLGVAGHWGLDLGSSIRVGVAGVGVGVTGVRVGVAVSRGGTPPSGCWTGVSGRL